MLAESPRYCQWRRRFIHQRLRLGLRLAVVVYLSFIAVRLLGAVSNPVINHPTWLVMAGLAELGLVAGLVLLSTPVGRRYPEVVFLTASWSVTLVEQIWATLSGFALSGLFAWTLVFLTQATLIPVRWQFHLLSQLGVLVYHFGINRVLGLQPLQSPSWDIAQMLYLLWFCGICDLSVLLYERLKRSEFQARLELEAEQERSERLLLNILPEAVARQLKQEHRTIAESFAEATVLFADIVGFTQISADMPPHEVVTLLNHIFSTFDQIADQHRLEKIKTIGDAYMVVGGLPLEHADHVAAIADMALDMQQALVKLSCELTEPGAEQRALQMRIGINTGPVVAGVIGRKKFIYDLWGDTVNVASRMESLGIAGCIQVTQTVYDRLKNNYLFEERGMIAVKGKGTMSTYLLQGKRSEVDR
jgi:class 3 adenylate cyclase